MNKHAFTLIEIVMVVAIMLILFQIAYVNLIGFQQNASVRASMRTFLSDMRQQQLRAMMGDTGGTGVITDYGIYLQTTKYTIYTGTTYTAGVATNFPVNLASNIRISVNTFTNSSIVFAKGSGDLSTSKSEETLTFSDTNSGKASTVHVNRLGVITQIQ